jgi:hypothetical protein
VAPCDPTILRFPDAQAMVDAMWSANDQVVLIHAVETTAPKLLRFGSDLPAGSCGAARFIIGAVSDPPSFHSKIIFRQCPASTTRAGIGEISRTRIFRVRIYAQAH